MEIYLAGPLFTQAERRWMRALANQLRSLEYGVFLPQDDAGSPLFQNPPDFHGAFEMCRDAVERADVVLAVLDGCDADSGTAWECGFAYARGKPIVALRTDFRGGEDSGLNLMLRRSAVQVIEHASTDEELKPLIERIHGQLQDLVLD